MRTGRTTHRPLTVAALLLALFMAAMEMTVVSTAMPTVVAELSGALHSPSTASSPTCMAGSR